MTDPIILFVILALTVMALALAVFMGLLKDLREASANADKYMQLYDDLRDRCLSAEAKLERMRKVMNEKDKIPDT